MDNDNASIHHVDEVLQIIENAGAKVIFLPPYSPDLNPLEPVFGKVKAILKENDKIFQACSSPRAFLAMAFGMITAEDLVLVVSFPVLFSDIKAIGNLKSVLCREVYCVSYICRTLKYWAYRAEIFCLSLRACRSKDHNCMYIHRRQDFRKQYNGQEAHKHLTSSITQIN